jgi:hypothetical protein
LRPHPEDNLAAFSLLGYQTIARSAPDPLPQQRDSRAPHVAVAFSAFPAAVFDCSQIDTHSDRIGATD